MRYKEIVNETATAGGTAAGGVATANMALGAGDPAASIYYTKKKKKKEGKMPIIRRPNPIESQKD